MLDKAKAPAEVLPDQGEGEVETTKITTNESTKPREPFQPGYGLALDQFDWGHPNQLQSQWLVSQGVSFNAMLCPWPVGATRVTFDGDYFDPDPSGKANALTFVCFDRGELIDIVAWQPKTGEIATYVGRAVFLGDEDDIFNPATWFGGDDLLIHASPIEWLRADQEGVVILDETKAEADARRSTSEAA